jgi:amino acid adenylation domain-containing protein
MMEKVERSMPTANSETFTFLFPTSFAQQRLWFFEQLYPGSTVYHLSTVLPFEGLLDRKALEEGLSDLLDRHEALRTTFTALDGAPVQLVAPALRIDMPLMDVSEPGGDCLERAREAARAALAEPFDLVRGPLLRASLLRLQHDYHWLVLVLHHIVADGWSLEVLHRDLRALYEARCRHEPAALPALPVQYADFACWQRRILQGERLDALFAYWQGQLKDAPAQLALPADRPRPAQSSYRGGRCGVSLDATLTARLRALGQTQGATLFMTLLAAFGVLLSRYSGQSDLVVGTPIANRTRSELEGLIGFFVNTLALRLDLSGNPPFTTLLERVRNVTTSAYTHQDMPFEMLVARLAPKRHLSQTPLFQVMFNLLNIGERGPEAASQPRSAEPDALPADRLDIPAAEFDEPTKFDLTLYAMEYDRTIRFEAVYALNLFESATMQRILGHFTTLLENIVDHPDSPLSRLRLTRDIPLGRNTVAPRIPFNPFPEQAIEQSIGSRFREQARHYPDHVAIWMSDHHWTYGKLDELSNRIANAVLAMRGEGAERIALLFRDGAYMIAAMLGVLKAGKTYIPLDPAHPEARIEQLIDSSGATAVLTDVTDFSSVHAQLILLAETECYDVSPTPSVSPDAVAYILYTSGSTGTPKGVVQTHRNVLRHVRTYSNNLHICVEDRLTFVSSYGVDAAIQDVFSALLNGATLYPVSVREEGVGALVNCLVEHEITVFHSTPTVFRHLVNDIPENARLEKLRLIALGGEAVYRRDVDLFRAHFSPDCLLVNGYGLTESTMALQYFIDHTTPLARDAVPIGYPVDGIELLLLDEAGEPPEVYCQGEIVLCGPSIALGYWRQGNITPFPADTNERTLYRTGDLGRRLPDGSIEFIGRRDFQVKVRGYRIEPGEIENQLLASPGVKQAAVIAEESCDGNGERLVGYVSAQPGHALAPSDLRRHLARQLPDYLVPSTFVVLEELPTTPSGKLDRLALPTPITLTDSFVPPQNAAEAKIAEIWRQILGIENIGVQDNFFSIGGHSLLATRVISRLRDEFGVELPLQQIFETPVIADLALIVTGAQSESVPLPAIRPLPRWRHRAKVSALGEVELSADLKALLERFASAGSPVQTAL